MSAPPHPTPALPSTRRGLLPMAAFLVVMLLVVGLTHLWLGVRMAGPFGEVGTRVVWALVGINAVLMPLSMVLGHRGGPMAQPLGWLGFTAMGFWSLIMAGLIVWELGWVAVWSWDRAMALLGQDLTSDLLLPADPAQRAAWSRYVVFAIVGWAAVAGGLGLAAARRPPRLVHLELPVQGLAEDLDGLRIVQITDIHVGPTVRGEFVGRVVERVNALEPDLVAVTGDLVDGPVERLAPEVAPLAGLRARHGSFFVTGNHEYISHAPSWLPELERLGLVVLDNEHRLVEHGAASVLVAGVTDPTGVAFQQGPAPDPAAAVDGAPPTDFRLLLAHQPRTARSAAEVGFDLVLSGHTHGGQFFPWTVAIYLFEPFIHGLHDLDGTRLYVSRGTGTWGPPLRWGAPTEITVVELRRE